MDLILLRRLIDELRPRLEGSRIDRIYAVPRHHLVFVLGDRSAGRLWLSAEADEPHLYLRSGPHPTPERPPGFAMAVRKRLRGRRLEAIRVVDDDRVVELRWTGDRARLLFEAMPRRSSIFLVDEDGSVVAVWNPRRGRPGVGEPYAPPPQRSRTAAAELDPDVRRGLRAERDPRSLARALTREVAGVTPLIAAEAAARALAGEDPQQAVAAELERAVTAPTEPVIYSTAPLGRLREPPSHRELIIAPYRLRSAIDLEATPQASLGEAAATVYPLRARLRLCARLRQEVRREGKKQRTRLRRARSRMERNRPADDDARRLRQQADLLLAHPEAAIEDGAVTVPNDYATGEPIRITIDPRYSVVENAQRRYRRAQRFERKLHHDAERLRLLAHRERRLDDLLDRAESLRDPTRIESLRGDAAALGIVLRTDPRIEPEVAAETGIDHGTENRRPTPKQAGADGAGELRGIDRYRSSDGHEILVGRSAGANDRLTHEVAQRHDWWLHAQGPGAHVVIRNPRRLEEPPATALLEAAGLAAHFSRARGATKVEVNWTRAGAVRRAKGGRPGAALLREHRTVLVEPLAPESLAPGDHEAVGDA